MKMGLNMMIVKKRQTQKSKFERQINAAETQTGRIGFLPTAGGSTVVVADDDDDVELGMHIAEERRSLLAMDDFEPDFQNAGEGPKALENDPEREANDDAPTPH